MNVVVLQGTLSSEPSLRTLGSGSQLVQLEVTTRGEDGTSSVPVAWFDPPQPVTLTVGTEVVVAGVVRRRFFRTGGATQSRTEVVAAQVVPASRRAAARRLVAQQVQRLGGAEGSTVRSG
ncbi:MAG: single-stranded DNA-binding protein [Acidimicrobiaceae bacterium]|nr:single-stranded DNA-binding protein [Ilumatobacter sp.]MCB9379977.1 single-stranded DNA-binding protein [Acidimicrobiaceae bacterium]MCO5330632.1 single-stranded DNA-binding protein [Ilumatobacteraceae bacterium]